MKLVVNSIMGSMMGAFCEGMALADKAGLSQADLLSVLDLGAMANPMFKLKGPAIQNRTYPPAFPLKHQQKDMRLALALGCVCPIFWRELVETLEFEDSWKSYTCPDLLWIPFALHIT